MLPSIEHALADSELLVRAFQPADSATLIAGRDGEFRRFLGEGSPDPRPSGCICVFGSVVGWIDYDRDDRAWLADDEVNVGYSVFSQYRGCGYGTRALRLVMKHLASFEPPYNATLLVDPTNFASLALAVRAGFVEATRVDGQLLMKHQDAVRP
jgi:RimJ/RimL family protein N-acetyltransferase